MYGNDVKVGDQFLPTHSDTIWTVENIKKSLNLKISHLTTHNKRI